VSTWDDLGPIEIDIVRKAVAAGAPITDPHLAPAAISEAERVRRANRSSWARLIVTAIALGGFAVFQLTGGKVVQGVVAGIAAAALIGFWQWQSPDVRRARATKASAEALLRGEA
jgi:hypothetical protein